MRACVRVLQSSKTPFVIKNCAASSKAKPPPVPASIQKAAAISSTPKSSSAIKTPASAIKAPASAIKAPASVHKASSSAAPAPKAAPSAAPAPKAAPSAAPAPKAAPSAAPAPKAASGPEASAPPLPAPCAEVVSKETAVKEAAAGKPPAPVKPPPPKAKKLPVPNLVLTLRKYLRSCRPFLTSDEFIKSEEIIKEFISPGGAGENLHELLEEKAKGTDNWLAEWWLNTAYLGYRSPVIIFSSPAQVFPWQLFTSDEDYVMCAAKVAFGALDYKNMIDDGKIKQEMMGKDPLDMEQYHKVFGTTRYPCIPLDRLRFAPKSEHFVVISNNQFFKVCTKVNGNPIDLSTLFHQLHYIFLVTREPGCRIGILTSEPRDTWAMYYDYITKDPAGCRSIGVIEDALFVLCMDRNCPEPSFNNKTTTALQVLHGGGVSQNASNRWHDKTLQFVVSRDGGVGITYEHSPAEGGLIASIMDHICFLLEKKMCYGEQPADMALPEKLCFNIDECLNEFMDKAAINIGDLIENLEVCCFSFDEYGKDLIKQYKVSPDSYIQLAIQYAFYRLHKVPGAHYESGSLRRFIKGRTEAIRSCSEDSINFAKAMLNPTLPCISKARALRGAIDEHKKYAIEAMDMKGVDRYLLGLRLIAEENCLPRPALFDDVAFKRSTHFRLSTSQVPSKCDGFMVYAPLTEDGYGCCYNPRDKNINFGTSAFRSTGETSALCFRENLEIALKEMKIVLTEPMAKL